MYSKLVTAAGLVWDRMDLKPEESFLVLTDHSADKNVADALFKAGRMISEKGFFVNMPPTGEHGKEPGAGITKLMRECSAVVCPTTFSLTHTKARKKAAEHGARVATMPGITSEIFTRALDVDYKSMTDLGNRIKRLLEKEGKIKVTTPTGTNIVFKIKQAIVDDGNISSPGAYGNLPAGEVFGIPVDANGVIVIDHFPHAKPRTKLYVKNSSVREIEGDPEFWNKIKRVKNATHLAEFGIGLNPSARLSGRILEEEKMLGTVHFAIGSDHYFGGKVKAGLHWDMILLKPTVQAGKTDVMIEGEMIL